MSVDVHIVDGFGIVKAGGKFILIIKGEIYGPFKKEYIKEILEKLEEK